MIALSNIGVTRGGGERAETSHNTPRNTPYNAIRHSDNLVTNGFTYKGNLHGGIACDRRVVFKSVSLTPSSSYPYSKGKGATIDV